MLWKLTFTMRSLSLYNYLYLTGPFGLSRCLPKFKKQSKKSEKRKTHSQDPGRKRTLNSKKTSTKLHKESNNLKVKLSNEPTNPPSTLREGSAESDSGPGTGGRIGVSHHGNSSKLTSLKEVKK